MNKYAKFYSNRWGEIFENTGECRIFLRIGDSEPVKVDGVTLKNVKSSNEVIQVNHSDLSNYFKPYAKKDERIREDFSIKQVIDELQLILDERDAKTIINNTASFENMSKITIENYIKLRSNEGGGIGVQYHDDVKEILKDYSLHLLLILSLSMDKINTK